MTTSSQSVVWGIDLKLDLKGIKFNTWLYLFLFSMAILLAIGLLQVTLIKPYFRDQRMNAIRLAANEINERLLGKAILDETDISDTFDLILNNNMCAIILSENGQVIYDGDALGAVCTFDRETELDGKSFIPKNEPQSLITMVEDGKTLTTSIISDISDQEMVLYGQKIEADLMNYYLFINSPIEPIESYIELFVDQFYLIAIFIFIAAIGISLILADRIASPIIKIRKEANKLRDGNFDLDFDIHSYTEINDLATTLDEAAERLETVDELRKDLIANVSHDIKTPLTMIKAYSEMIRDISGDDKEKRNKHLAIILEETDHLDKLVDDMREVSKLQAGQNILKRTNFDLQEMIEKIVKNYQETIIKGTSMKIEMETVPCVVWADETGIFRVISNFVSNAIKYSFDDSVIIIRMIDSEDKVRVEVIDDGRGIAESELPYIWTRYYKIDKGFARNSNSTGLGLAIAKAILEAHGAKYGVTSKVNVGSTFYFELSKDYDTKGSSQRD